MASTLPARTGQDKPVFIPPKRRTASGKSATMNTPTRTIYGDQILNVQGRNPGSVDCLVEHQDVLGSLEKVPSGSVGTMRSTRSNGSVPTLERVRREESNHSIGSHSQTSSGQISERSTDIDLVREAVHTKRNLRTARLSESRLSRSTSRSSQPSVHSTHTSNDELDQVSVLAADERIRGSRPLPERPPSAGRPPGGIQNRPLPEVPSCDNTPAKLQLRINPEDEAIEIINSENVSIGGARNVSLRQEWDKSSGETSLLVSKQASDRSGFLTLMGTIKRGKNKGECFDVQLKMDQNKLQAMQRSQSSCCCGLRRGPHIFLLSLVCLPLLWIWCTLYSFYVGTLTWYNVFIYYNEQRTCCHTIFVSPCVLLLYPVWILPVTLLLGFYGGYSQLAWSWERWRQEVLDPEKGFYGWICNKMALPDCSPYQVVILSSLPHDPLTVSSMV